jgi:hypothetical protein
MEHQFRLLLFVCTEGSRCMSVWTRLHDQ